MRNLPAILTILAAAGLSGCVSNDVDFRRVPASRVYLPFTTAGQWDIFGAGAPMTSRRFIYQPPEVTPANYPWQDFCYTGYGGVLLLCDINATPRAYDLSCPVERQRDVRVYIDVESNLAKCPKCGSTYDVFLLNGALPGSPVSGPAAVSAYGLRNFNVVFGADGRYALVTQ